MSREWVAWHEGYRPGSRLARRLAIVRRLIRSALDHAPRGRIRLLSLCAGDGRDILGVLADHPRAREVEGLLIDRERALVARGRQRLAALGLSRLRFVRGDASRSTSAAPAVPAQLVLACGIFGNVSDRDVARTIAELPRLCARGGTVIWTRGRFPPDLTPTIRRWFVEAGFAELAFRTVRGSTAAVGAHRLRSAPLPFRSGVRLFAFLPKAERPSAGRPSRAVQPAGEPAQGVSARRRPPNRARARRPPPRSGSPRGRAGSRGRR